MARLLSSSGWFAANIVSGDFMAAAGGTATVYADAAATTLADIASYDGTNTPGPSIVGSMLTLDGNSMLPQFWLPDGVNTVYVKVGSGPAVSVSADPTARQDAAESAWTTYAGFTITASTTNPAKGNSTYIARYKQIGKTVQLAFKVDIGSTFSPGSGTYSFSLPVAANGALLAQGVAKVFDSGTANLVAAIDPVGSTTCQVTIHNSGGSLGSAGPGTPWAGGDYIRGSITYEAA